MEAKMKFREKLLILFAAVILSALGFFLISSSFAELHTLAKKAGIDQLEPSLSEGSRCKSQQILCLNFYDGGSCFLRTPGASK